MSFNTIEQEYFLHIEISFFSKMASGKKEKIKSTLILNSILQLEK